MVESWQPPPQLVDYVLRMRTQGYSDEQIKSALLHSKWQLDHVNALFAYIAHTARDTPALIETNQDHPVKKAEKETHSKDQPKKKRSVGRIILYITFAVLLLLLGVGVYFYFTIISPLGGPLELEKPDTNAPTQDKITYILSKLGAHKIHSDPFSGERAEIEIKVIPSSELYTTHKDGGTLATQSGAAIDPDLRIILSRASLETLLEASDIPSRATQMVLEQDVVLEILKGEEILALKGYKAIYDSVQ